MTKMGQIMTRLLQPGDTPLKVAERFESVRVVQYVKSELNQKKKSKSKVFFSFFFFLPCFLLCV